MYTVHFSYGYQRLVACARERDVSEYLRTHDAYVLK